MTDLLIWSSAGLATVGALFIGTLVLRRLRLARRERRTLEAEARLRPSALALLGGDTVDVNVASRFDRPVLASLLAQYSRRLNGSERLALSVWFERSGGVERELAALSSRKVWRRAAAAYKLGDMSSAIAVSALVASLGDNHRDVRAAAARSLGRLGDAAAIEPLVESLGQRRVPHAVAGSSLLELGAVAVPELRRLVAHDDPAVRAIAVELLGLLGGPGDDSLLTARLSDAAAEVRAKAAWALGRLGAEEATAELRRTLHDRISFVRTAAAHALRLVNDRESVPALLEIARFDSFDPAQAAARALAAIDPQALLLTEGQSAALTEAADRLNLVPV